MEDKREVQGIAYVCCRGGWVVEEETRQAKKRGRKKKIRFLNGKLSLRENMEKQSKCFISI